jgi:hypothetical protein
MASLRTNLDSLASAFANAVFEAVRGASLEELLHGGLIGGAVRTKGGGRGRPSGALPTMGSRSARVTKTGRLRRRTPEEIAKTLESVIALVKKSKGGLRAEQIRKQLGLQSKEMPRILKEGLAKKKLKAKGQKRATAYSAV